MEDYQGQITKFEGRNYLDPDLVNLGLKAKTIAPGVVYMKLLDDLEFSLATSSSFIFNGFIIGTDGTNTNAHEFHAVLKVDGSNNYTLPVKTINDALVDMVGVTLDIVVDNTLKLLRFSITESAPRLINWRGQIYGTKVHL